MKNLFLGLVFTVLFSMFTFSQVPMPREGEMFEFITETKIPNSFDLSNVDENPYNFSYVSEKGKALNFNLIKSNSEVKFALPLEDAKNSTIDFYNDGKLVGSFPATDFPEYQVNVHPTIIIGAIVAACCVKIKFKNTTVSGNPPKTTTTFDVGWDCNCLSISLRNGHTPKANIIVKGKEIQFDNFTISNNLQFNEKDYSLVVSH